MEERSGEQEENASEFCEAMLLVDHYGGVQVPLNEVTRALRRVRGESWVSDAEVNLAFADAVQCGLVFTSWDGNNYVITLSCMTAAEGSPLGAPLEKGGPSTPSM